MKVFLFFLILCFISGLVLVKMKPEKRAGFILALCFMLSLAYYFFNKI